LRGKRQEVGGRRQEARGKRQEAGGRREEIFNLLDFGLFVPFYLAE